MTEIFWTGHMAHMKKALSQISLNPDFLRPREQIFWNPHQKCDLTVPFLTLSDAICSFQPLILILPRSIFRTGPKIPCHMERNPMKLFIRFMKSTSNSVGKSCEKCPEHDFGCQTISFNIKFYGKNLSKSLVKLETDPKSCTNHSVWSEKSGEIDLACI